MGFAVDNLVWICQALNLKKIGNPAWELLLDKLFTFQLKCSMDNIVIVSDSLKFSKNWNLLLQVV